MKKLLLAALFFALATTAFGQQSQPKASPRATATGTVGCSIVSAVTNTLPPPVSLSNPTTFSYSLDEEKVEINGVMTDYIIINLD